jgi:dipeptidyl-peptidase-4
VDEKKQLVYFEGLYDTPLEKHFYSISLNGGTPGRLTREPGYHLIKVPEQGSTFVDSYSSLKQPWQTVVKDFEGKTIAAISNNLLDKTHPYFPFAADHTAPEIKTLNAVDGTLLYYSLTKPPHFDSSRKYPVIVSVYGGPTAQDVSNVWHIGFNQYLARNGYIVFELDNRGGANRGKAFEDVLYRNMADIEVQDQLRGVEFLKTLPYVDQNRIGVFGWSYGGYMTLHLMMKGSGIFKAGVSGAPVTDFRLYDTHYTERYLGNPNQDEDAYTRSSVYTYLNDLKGDLLLIHGMADDNVIFDNSVRLMSELEKRGILFELMTYPGERHGIYDVEKGLHRWKTIFNFFERKLKK